VFSRQVCDFTREQACRATRSLILVEQRTTGLPSGYRTFGISCQRMNPPITSRKAANMRWSVCWGILAQARLPAKDPATLAWKLPDRSVTFPVAPLVQLAAEDNGGSD